MINTIFNHENNIDSGHYNNIFKTSYKQMKVNDFIPI